MERSAPPSPAPLAPCAGPAPPPGAAMERPGPPEGSAEPAVGSALALGRAAAGHGSASRRGCQSRSRGRGLERDAERGAGGRRSPRSEGRCLQSLQMELGRPAAAAAGSGQGRAPPPGGAALPPRLSTARFAVPAALELEAGPAPWVCTRPGARPSRPAAELEPRAFAAPRDRPPLSLFIVNVNSHADFALALSVSCAATLVRALCAAA